MSETRPEPGYYRAKAAHMRRLSDQALNEAARTAYRLLEASWLRLADLHEKKAGSDAAETQPASAGSAAWHLETDKPEPEQRAE